MLRVDLNADVGESFGPYVIGDDRALLPLVTSANIAAGIHAGDPLVLRATLRLAKEHGVSVGAHPGFPDRVGFGRRVMFLSAAEVEDFVLYQTAVVAGVAAAEGLRLCHVKAHGALYNMAARDAGLAAALCRGVAAVDRSLVIVGPPDSAILREAAAAGLPVAAEGFADRAYRADGSLVPREEAGAVIADPEVVAARAVRMVRDQCVLTLDGHERPITVETLCIHGDTPNAAAIAQRLRAALGAAGIAVSPLRD